MKPGPVKEAIMVPWRLDSEGRPPNIEVVIEAEAAIGTVLGAGDGVKTHGRALCKHPQSNPSKLVAG